MIAVYVNELNLVGAIGELIRTIDYLKKEFSMKKIYEIQFCLDLRVNVQKKEVLNYFHIDKSYLLNSLIVVRSPKVKKNSFRLKEDNEVILGLAVP